MKTMPKIQKVMSTQPHTIGQDIRLKTAMNMMREHGVRHLPVEQGGKLVGVLTDRDVKLVSAFKGSDSMTVEEAMTPDPYTVGPDVALDHVVSEMAEHKYGCAIVMQDNGKVVGIFTANDGLRVLAETLKTRYHE
ncbi:MAG: CBS domain-containing protein [Xanthomonadaceae bacterium]|nr:CBS domain-containing protein [Xanthomonadaceae bacterium]